LAKGFTVTGLQDPQMPFSIVNAYRPYISVSTTVLHCDYYHLLINNKKK